MERRDPSIIHDFFFFFSIFIIGDRRFESQIFYLKILRDVNQLNYKTLH